MFCYNELSKLNPNSITKFIDPLPTPPKINFLTQCNSNNISIEMCEFYQTLHSQIPPTKLWGFNKSYPGPTFYVRKDFPINVTWLNNLPSTHILPNDCTIDGCCGNPQVKTVVHLHGAVNPSESDGIPEAWFTNNFNFVGPLFENRTYFYPNLNKPCTLWYHDHSIGTSRLNVYAGLAGMYIVEDDYSLSLNLPKGNYDIPLVIQDRDFYEDGSLFYPRNDADAGSGMSMGTLMNEMNSSKKSKCSDAQDSVPTCSCGCPKGACDVSFVPDFFGSFNLVNGRVWPYLEVEPRKYRFRVLNGSNGRFYNLLFSKQLEFYVIGNDLGFLEAPVTVNSLLIGPAERYDIVVDFSKYKNSDILLLNDSKAADSSGDYPDQNSGTVMLFKISNCTKSKDTSLIPDNFITYPILNPKDACTTRKITLQMRTDDCGRVEHTLNNKLRSNEINETPELGDTEIWEFINQTDQSHPMHLHLVHFFTLESRKIKEQSGKISYAGPCIKTAPESSGPKDTVIVPAFTSVKVIAKFVPYTGLYEYHCHVLEHEDYEMSRPFRVITKRYI